MNSRDIYILGLSFDYHDSAAALVKNGQVMGAVHEERFTRKKHDADFPAQSVTYVLKEAGITIDRVDYVVFYEKPLLKFERLLLTYLKTWPKGWLSFIKAMLSFTKSKLWVDKRIRKELGGYMGEVLYMEHHYSHAASAYYASNFPEAAVITMDGVGEFDTTTVGLGKGNKLTLEKTIEFPHSLGLLYSAVTYYLGFKVNSAEYKVMGLAPYGNPDVFYGQMKKLIDVKDDGSFRLNMKYFSYEYGLRMTNRAFDNLFGAPPRKPESPLTQREKDIAAALQKITNEIVYSIAKYAKTLTNSPYLCLAGGVALNCVANGKLLESKLFEKIYIQPAAGDAGGSVGAALFVYYHVLRHEFPAVTPPMASVYLGPAYTDEEIRQYLDQGTQELIGSNKKIIYTRYDDDVLLEKVADLISGTNVLGWFQGRMEFGPRSLGNRSIIADPRNKENWQKVNLKIKFRESFRPFAPSVLADKVNDCFNLSVESPYMLLVAPVTRQDIPAVTHVDGSARIQTVTKAQNPRFYELLQAFHKKTNCPVIINTSFNVRGEPIVCSPRDALNTFLHTFMDYLILGNYVIVKKDNMHLVDENEMQTYLSQFSLD